MADLYLLITYSALSKSDNFNKFRAKKKITGEKKRRKKREFLGFDGERKKLIQKVQLNLNCSSKSH